MSEADTAGLEKVTELRNDGKDQIVIKAEKEVKRRCPKFSSTLRARPRGLTRQRCIVTFELPGYI